MIFTPLLYSITLNDEKSAKEATLTSPFFAISNLEIAIAKHEQTTLCQMVEQSLVLSL